MISYLDRTWCASPNCENKCGRKLSNVQTREIILGKYCISYSYFCDDKGELLNKEENK